MKRWCDGQTERRASIHYILPYVMLCYVMLCYIVLETCDPSYQQDFVSYLLYHLPEKAYFYYFLGFRENIRSF